MSTFAFISGIYVILGVLFWALVVHEGHPDDLARSAIQKLDIPIPKSKHKNFWMISHVLCAILSLAFGPLVFVLAMYATLAKKICRWTRS